MDAKNVTTVMHCFYMIFLCHLCIASFDDFRTDAQSECRHRRHTIDIRQELNISSYKIAHLEEERSTAGQWVQRTDRNDSLKKNSQEG